MKEVRCLSFFRSTHSPSLQQTKCVSTTAAFPSPDPFTASRRSGRDLLQTILATAFFRCWHIIIFFAAWSTFVTVWNDQHNTPAGKKRQLDIGASLLTVYALFLYLEAPLRSWNTRAASVPSSVSSSPIARPPVSSDIMKAGVSGPRSSWPVAALLVQFGSTFPVSLSFHIPLVHQA